MQDNQSAAISVLHEVSVNLHFSHMSILTGNNFTLQPVDVNILIGQNASFQCGFTGVSPPLWDVFSSDGQLLSTLSDGKNDHPYSYPSVDKSPAVINVNTSSDSINNTCFQCRINRVDDDILSDMARLTVFGEPKNK